VGLWLLSGALSPPPLPPVVRHLHPCVLGQCFDDCNAHRLQCLVPCLVEWRALSTLTASDSHLFCGWVACASCTLTWVLGHRGLHYPLYVYDWRCRPAGPLRLAISWQLPHTLHYAAPCRPRLWVSCASLVVLTTLAGALCIAYYHLHAALWPMCYTCCPLYPACREAGFSTLSPFLLWQLQSTQATQIGKLINRMFIY
jgi:hypothetical protein